ncbi:MAG: hypothetical protein Q6M04_15450 [Thermostichus sp. BF3_bins_97]
MLPPVARRRYARPAAYTTPKAYAYGRLRQRLSCYARCGALRRIDGSW